MTLEELAFKAAKRADRIGCTFSMQVGELPDRSDINADLMKLALRLTNPKYKRVEVLEELAAYAIFAHMSCTDPSTVASRAAEVATVASKAKKASAAPLP